MKKKFRCSGIRSPGVYSFFVARFFANGPNAFPGNDCMMPIVMIHRDIGGGLENVSPSIGKVVYNRYKNYRISTENFRCFRLG